MIARLALAAILLAAPAVAPTLASAQPPGPPPGGGPPPGEGGDRPRREQIFISPAGEPFRAPLGQPYPVVAWFAQADTNHDGALTREEFTADALAFYARLDADHDGWLDGFEINDYEKKVAPEILGRLERGDVGVGGQGRPPSNKRGADGGRAKGAGPPQPYGLGRSGAGLYGLINEVQPVMGQDSDFNRRVERKEVVAAARDRFAILDKDKDGKLPLDTLPQTPLQRAFEEAR